MRPLSPENLPQHIHTASQEKLKLQQAIDCSGGNKGSLIVICLKGVRRIRSVLDSYNQHIFVIWIHGMMYDIVNPEPRRREKTAEI